MRVRHLVLLLVAACGADGTPPILEPDASPVPDGAPRDGGFSLPFVDFAASGCTGFDPGLVVCSGQAPLELRFLAVAPAPLDAFLWSFGDGSPPETTPSPVHRYPLPGAFGVRLTVGGPGGTAQAAKDAYVIVLPAAVGARCEVPEQCAAGLDCLCAGGVGCPAPLAGGLCTRSCAGSPCAAGQACALLGDGPATWQDSVCLRACTGAADCPGGRCQELRAEAGGWTRACVPDGLLGDEGAVCADEDGAPDDDRCVSGTCAPLGARGLCAGSCGGMTCPSYASCATFAGNVKRCLAACSAERPCTADPWLACEAPDASGSLGFTVTPSAGLFCAPRRCTLPAECGPDGTCQSGFCQAL